MLLQDALKVNGKVRRSKWPSDQYLFLPEDRTCFISCKEGCASHDVDLSVENILADDYEPYKEPCAHEPEIAQTVRFTVNRYGGADVSEISNLINRARNPICKHCGVKIRAKEWVEYV